jgi:hypothetical protein
MVQGRALSPSLSLPAYVSVVLGNLLLGLQGKVQQDSRKGGEEED